MKLNIQYYGHFLLVINNNLGREIHDSVNLMTESHNKVNVHTLFCVCSRQQKLQ